MDINEKINCIKWLPNQGNNLYLMTASDKIVKLWKVGTVFKKEVVLPTSSNMHSKVIIPKTRVVNKYYQNSLKQTYSNLHNYHINSVSLSSNRQHFLTADDLRVYLWTIENSSQAFNLVDLKPPTFDETYRVITACKYHTIFDYEFAYSSSQGHITRVDLRQSAKGGTIAELKHDRKLAIAKSKNHTLDYEELIACVTDFDYSADGRFIFARDLLGVNVWDTAKLTEPVATVQLFKPSFEKLDALYNNEAIYEKFRIAVSPTSNQFATGSFNGFFVGDAKGNRAFQYFEDLSSTKQLADESVEEMVRRRRHPKYKTKVDKILPGNLRDLESDFTERVINIAWNHRLDCIVAACKGTLYWFNKPQPAKLQSDT